MSNDKPAQPKKSRCLSRLSARRFTYLLPSLYIYLPLLPCSSAYRRAKTLSLSSARAYRSRSLFRSLIRWLISLAPSPLSCDLLRTLASMVVYTMR